MKDKQFSRGKKDVMVNREGKTPVQAQPLLIIKKPS